MLHWTENRMDFLDKAVNLNAVSFANFSISRLSKLPIVFVITFGFIFFSVIVIVNGNLEFSLTKVFVTVIYGQDSDRSTRLSCLIYTDTRSKPTRNVNKFLGFLRQILILVGYEQTCGITCGVLFGARYSTCIHEINLRRRTARQISSRSDLKRRSLRHFEEGRSWAPNKKNSNKNHEVSRELAIWD